LYIEFPLLPLLNCISDTIECELVRAGSSLQETSLATLPELALLCDSLFMIASAWSRCNGREGWWNDTFAVPYVSPHSEGAQEERLLELGEETVEEDMD